MVCTKLKFRSIIEKFHEHFFFYSTKDSSSFCSIMKQLNFFLVRETKIGGKYINWRQCILFDTQMPDNRQFARQKKCRRMKNQLCLLRMAMDTGHLINNKIPYLFIHSSVNDIDYGCTVRKIKPSLLFEHPWEIEKKYSICNCQLSNSRHICLSLVDWIYEHIYKTANHMNTKW